MLGRIIEWSVRNVFLVLLGAAFVVGFSNTTPLAAERKVT